MRTRVLNEVHALDNALQQIDDILPGNEKNEVRAVMQKIQHMRFKKYDEYALATEFDKALAHKDITAWIIGSDRDAVPAFNYLHQRKVRIPQDLSIISFDDSVDSFARGITSYNFNVEAVMHAIVDFLLHPPLMPRKKRASWADIEGFIVERSTVGKV